jgi:tetratricopeptide (TPR) repeat protein
MDPLSRAAQELVRQLAEAWRETALVRLVAPASHRTYLLRSLRLFEWAPDNHWPLCVVEAPAGDAEHVAQAAADKVIADYAELRRAFAEEGVPLAEVQASVAGEDSWRRLQRVVEQAGAALAGTGMVAGLALAVVPAPHGDRRTIGRIAGRLRSWPERAQVRVGLWCDADELAEVIPAAARFGLDEAALREFCSEQTERQIGSGPPEEALVQRHLLVAAEAARRDDVPAAKRAYEAAGAELERQGKRAEAAVVQIALGGLSFGLGDANAALAYFDVAAAQGEATGQSVIASQAHLGAAGCLFAGQAYADAAVRYRAAASAGPDALGIEALRMAGVAHAKLGEREAAAEAWQAAVDRASGMTPQARAQTSWKQAGEALLELLQRRGLTAQYEHLYSVVNGEADRAGGG